MAGSPSLTLLGGRKLREMRKSSRRSVGAIGWIKLDGGFATRECRVLDVSDTGVRIVADGQSVPTVFTLTMSRGGSGRRARVKWRNGAQIGAEFY